MSSTHTPGPWVVDDIITKPSQLRLAQADGWFGWASDRNLPLANVWKGDNRSSTGLPGNIEVGLANARLIAAAPCLYAACKAASDLLGDLAAQLNPSGAPSETHLIPLGVRAQLEAALAKAEGGAS